jgi:FkbM family methyltransferase
MRSEIREGLTVLSEEGPLSFLREVLSYFYEIGYWSVHGSYALAIRDTEVSFTAPNRKVVERNKRRFNSEKRELTDLLNEIGADDVFLDVGANTGLYTLFAAKRCSNAKVVAFEPYPPNMRLLKRDIERNELENVDTWEVALSDSAGTVEFDQPEQEDVGYGSGSIESEPGNPNSTVEVAAKTGDELISDGEVPTPSIVKIDVEGAEPLVVEGMKDALSTPECRLVYCEIHRSDVEYRPSIGDFGMTLPDMKARFEELGFEVEELQTRGSEVFLKAHK